MRSRFATAATITALVLSALALFAAGATAAPPPQLAMVPEDGKPGDGAGRIDLPRGIAADPKLPGHIYVVDGSNNRIDEFTPWGEFVKAWGWGVDKATPEAKLQSCTEPSGCQKGEKGAGDGEFKTPEAIAADGAGDVYVLEAANHRIQKFDPTGGVGESEAVFLGAFGEGKLVAGEFAYPNKIAACASDSRVFVGEGERIQVFEANAFKEEISMGAGKEVRGLASDSTCNLYVAFQGQAEVRKLKSSGPGAQFLTPSFAPESPAERPFAVAVDGHGDLYVAVESPGTEPGKVQKYSPTGSCLSCGKDGESEVVEVGGKPVSLSGGFDRSRVDIRSLAASSACESDDAYVAHFSSGTLSYFNIFGDPPSTTPCPQPAVAPEVKAQYAVSVESAKAELQADINPRFWDDASFEVEYGTSPCFTGGCTQTTAPTPLTTQTIGNPVATPGVFLEGLSPGTTYHYRFVAQSSGGGPAYGVDPDGRAGPEEASFEDGREATFTTYRTPAIESCPSNQAFRSGPSELLPDCRAYELVSPLDKEGGDIKVLPEFTTTLPSALSQSASSGDRIAYGSYRSFAGAASAPYSTQYVAGREAGVGWATHPISPPRGRLLVSTGAGFDTEFRAFSPDLCEAWLGTYAEPSLAPEAPAGYLDLYRREDEECGGPGYEALNTVVPPNFNGGPPVGVEPFFAPELLGRSGDGSTAVFLANDALAEGGSAGPFQLYGSREGAVRFLCVLPGGAPLAGSCTAGGSTVTLANGRNRTANVSGALSADGSKVFWSATNGGAPGKIYLRENPFGEGGECGGEGSPCTIAVSQAAEEAAGTTAVGSQFWAAAKDGSRALFSTGGRLYEFVLAEPASPHLIAGKVLSAPLGASADATRVYFVSEEALGSPNAEGKSAQPGQANLYFHEGGSTHFIGVLSGEDLSQIRPSPISALPYLHDSRVTADGLHAGFVSTAPLTGYDNTDQSSGKADAEVFLYSAGANAGAGGLVCASCNPSGARPQGKEMLSGRFSSGPGAARIPGAENNLYASRVLSEDGKRLYFDSQDALVPRDSNGREDVYQWEAPGEGRCSESSSTFSPLNGGCVDLVSSGQSKLDSGFLDASPSGGDVFFTTISGLLPQDYGLQDVYDARVDGGLPSPTPPAAGCSGEACQGPYVPPSDTTPSSSSFKGTGNVKEARAKKRHKHKKRQAKKHSHHRAAKRNHGGAK